MEINPLRPPAAPFASRRSPWEHPRSLEKNDVAVVDYSECSVRLPAGAQRCESGADARVRPTGKARRNKEFRGANEWGPAAGEQELTSRPA